jgi:hypothetical protein
VKTAGIWKHVSNVANKERDVSTHFAQLSPIKHISVIKLEDELIVDFCLRKLPSIKNE